jgi:DNA polymerase
MAGLPRALDKATAMLGMVQRKNPEGVRLIKRFCGPRKPTKADPRRRILPSDDPTSFSRFVMYCVDDVKAERALDNVLPPMPQSELDLFELDFRINERGIPLDEGLVRKAHKIVTVLEQRAQARMLKMTGGIKATQVARLRAWLNDRGVPLANLQAESIRRMLPTVTDEQAAYVLCLRIDAGKVSTKKLAAMLRCMHGGRARGTILFHGAHTGRWSGKLIQPHNFVRGLLSITEQEAVIAALALGDPDVMELVWAGPLDAISQVMRSFITATTGKHLFVADYAAIEARVLAWLADEMNILKALAAGKDVYRMMAASLYRVPLEAVTQEQRRIGKSMVLGCGFGLGHVKFVDYCERNEITITEEFSREAVNAYRETHPATVRYWATVQRAFVRAVQRKEETRLPHGVAIGWERGWAYITLPSGRRLWYWNPKVEQEKDEKGEPAFDRNGLPRLSISYADTPHSRDKLYGGKLVENIVQAVARDIMANGMQRAEAAGYPIVSTVHDEVLAERTLGQGSIGDYVSHLCALPAWARGCPVKAEGEVMLRYRKL